MTDTRDKILEWQALRESKDKATQLKAASLFADIDGDVELSAFLKQYSDALNAVGSDQAVELIARYREELAKLLAVRRATKHMKFHEMYSDDDVLEFSAGEVTTPHPVDTDMMEYMDGGIYDPKIFGGQGSIPLFNEEGTIDPKSVDDSVPPIYFGHIELPLHVVTNDNMSDICRLLSLPDETYWKLQMCTLYAAFTGKNEYSFITDKEYLKGKCDGGLDADTTYLTGGDALHRMLADLNCPGHPEKYAFRILPVAPVYLRRCAIDSKEDRIEMHPLSHLYTKVALIASRIKRLQSLQAPTVIIQNEYRLLTEAVNVLFGTPRHPEDDQITKFSLKRFRDRFRQENARRRSIYDLSTAMRQRFLFCYPQKPFGTPNKIEPYAGIAQTANLHKADGTVETVQVRDVLNKLIDESSTAIMDSSSQTEDSERDRLVAASEAYDDAHDQIRAKALSGESVEIVEDSEVGYRLL